jgi:hypothetical protein
MTMRARIGSKIISIAFACTTLLLSLLLVFTPARSSERPSLLYATAEVGNKLVAFSLEAKRARVIGDIGFGISLPLAFCPPGRIPYTISNLFGPGAQLATLNLGRGTGTLVGSRLGQPQDIMGMTCSPHGTLYAVGQSDPTNPDYNSLYVINRVTGLASRMGSTGVSDGSGNDFLMSLAFASNGDLYGANTTTLFRINTATGTATKVVDFVGVSSVMGLAIDSDGNFYVADFVARSRVYTVNTGTGVATPILDTGLAFVHNIAFRTPG